MSDVEQELREATGLKAKGSDRQQQLSTLFKAVDELQDEEWRRLSQEAQDWCNAASDAIRDGEEITDFNTEEDTNDEEAQEAQAEQEAESEAEAAEAAESAGEPRRERKAMTSRKGNGEAPKKAKAPAVSKQKPKAAAKPAAKPAKAVNERGEGAPTIIRREVIRNPQITSKELEAILAKKGSKPSPLTVAAIRAHTISTLKMLAASGNLKGLKL